MEKYTHENQEETSVKVRLYNIVIYPEECQSEKRYSELFESVKKEKIRINTYADKNTRIRTMFAHGDLLYGTLINYTKLNGDGWFNEETGDIENVDINPNLNPNSKEWSFYFLPKAHRLAIYESPNVSASQISKFFEEALNVVADKNIGETVKVSVVATEDVIESIFTAQQLTQLKIKVSYTNNDNNDEWEEIIDEQMKANEISETETIAKGTKKKPIKLKVNSFLGGMLKLSRENGYAEATLLDDGKRTKISTKEHPLITEIRYNDENTFLDKVKERILALSRRNGKA